MRLLLFFGRAYPGRTAVMAFCLLLAALADGIGLSTMLPLLAVVAAPDAAAREGSPISTVEAGVHAAFDAMGLEPTIGLMLAIIVLAMVIKAGLMLLAQRQVGYTVAHVATDLRLALLRALLATRWEYYVRQATGALANAYATEAFRASQSYLQGTMILGLAMQAFVYWSIAVAVSWQVTIGAILIGGTAFLALDRLVRMSRRAGLRETRLMKSVLGRLTDMLYAVKPLKAMARDRLVGPLLEKETERLNRALRRDVLSKEALTALQEPLLVATIAGGLYVAVAHLAMELDRVFLLALLFGRLLGHINRMQKHYQRMANAESAFWSLRQTIDDCEKVREETSGTTPPTLQREIVLDSVTLVYDEHPVLRDASLSIPAGRVTVIIGPSGSGKTSIVDLVTGLVRPRQGEVRIDGVPLDQIDLIRWREKIGYVPQETLLLHESVLINVTLGDPELDERDAEQALRAAGAWEFVSALPEGARTLVGERGARLSGGQRQRIAIARALVHRPVLLVLDEATANLDPDSAATITATVSRLRGDITVLAVSHQSALLDAADVIYRVDEGRAEPVAIDDDSSPRATRVRA